MFITRHIIYGVHVRAVLAVMVAGRPVRGLTGEVIDKIVLDGREAARARAGAVPVLLHGGRELLQQVGQGLSLEAQRFIYDFLQHYLLHGQPASQALQLVKQLCEICN